MNIPAKPANQTSLSGPIEPTSPSSQFVRKTEKTSSSVPATANPPSATHTGPQIGAIRTVLPARLAKLESPQPISAFDDDPVFDSIGAARFLGVTVECLKKWRQRQFGPDFIQYGENGPIRYALSALRQFRSQCTIKPERLR